MENKTQNKRLETTYLSKLVGKKFESVYNQTYEAKDGKGYNVRIKFEDGSEAMLVLNKNENEFYGKYFKRGNKLRVYKNKKGYAGVAIDDAGNSSSSSFSNNYNSRKASYANNNRNNNSQSNIQNSPVFDKVLTDAGIRMVVRNAIYQLKGELINKLKDDGYDVNVLNRVENEFSKVLSN